MKTPIRFALALAALFLAMPAMAQTVGALSDIQGNVMINKAHSRSQSQQPQSQSVSDWARDYVTAVRDQLVNVNDLLLVGPDSSVNLIGLQGEIQMINIPGEYIANANGFVSSGGAATSAQAGGAVGSSAGSSTLATGLTIGGLAAGLAATVEQVNKDNNKQPDQPVSTP